MIHTVRHADELYVYYNGELIYKRWVGAGYGIVFEKSGPPWKPSERDASRTEAR